MGELTVSSMGMPADVRGRSSGVSEGDTAGRPKYWEDIEHSENHRAQLDLVPPGSRVLEIGAGPGHMSRALVAKGCTVTAVEQDEALAASARHTCQRLIISDVESQDFESLLGEERFEVVLLGDVLEHLRDPEEFLRRLRTHLGPSGRLVVCLPNVAHGAVRLSLLEGRFDYTSEGLLDRTHLRFFTLSSLREMFRAAGYTITDLRRIRRGFFATEIRLDPAAVPLATLRLLCRDPEAATYQFVFRAKPEHSTACRADTEAGSWSRSEVRQLTSAMRYDYKQFGRESLFSRPPDVHGARRLFYRAFRLAPSIWGLSRLLVTFLPYPIIDGLDRVNGARRRGATRR